MSEIINPDPDYSEAIRQEFKPFVPCADVSLENRVRMIEQLEDITYIAAVSFPRTVILNAEEVTNNREV